MANFRKEGHGTMTGTYDVLWRVEPTTAPCPWRHCSSCGGSRPFRSDGKIRLNANGRKLDAWLIYKCSACERTWNRPVAERLAVDSISRADLQAMQRSDPAWVRVCEFDLGALRRYCERIELSPAVRVVKTPCERVIGPWSVIILTVSAPLPTGMRLDRLLAAELKLSRSQLVSMHRTGAVQVGPAEGTGLKKLVSGRLSVRFTAYRIPGEDQRTAMARQLFE